MAQLIFTIPDAQVTRVIDGIVGYFGYAAMRPGATVFDPPVPNPETKSQFARRMIATQMKEWVKAYESTLAAEAARLAAQNDAEGGVGITP